MADSNLTELTADIVAGYVGSNAISPEALPELIRTVYGALSNIGSSAAISTLAEKVAPAVPVKKSITPDYLISLEDGQKYKSLKRHLRTKYGMSPEEYRAKWDLPKDYPMVAPNYSASRSALAKQMGLGAGGKKPPATPKGRASKTSGG